MKNLIRNLPWIGNSGEEARGTAALLQAIPIFVDLDRAEIASIERILHHREYKAGEIIFREGEPGMGMYIILSGKVTIISEPREVLFAELTEGEFFGELSLLDDAPRSATAIAQTPTTALGFFQPDLYGLLERSPGPGAKVVLRLAGIIGARLRTVDAQLQAALEQLEVLQSTG